MAKGSKKSKSVRHMCPGIKVTGPLKKNKKLFREICAAYGKGKLKKKKKASH